MQRQAAVKDKIFSTVCDVAGFGVTTDGVTTFVNASSVDAHYIPVNSPIIFDVPLPPGVTKY